MDHWAGATPSPATGSDFLQLDPAAAPPRGRTDWLTTQLRAAIVQSRLPAGTRLPATRSLAAELGIARGVVVEAYQRLGEEGLTASRPRAGTTVRPRPHAFPDTPVPQARMPLLAQPGPRDGIEYDLSPGLPDLSHFPRAAWLRAEREVLAQASGADLGYGEPAGAPALRAELARWLGRTRGVRATEGDIVVVAGVAQALALLAQVQHARGRRRIGVEDPGSRGAADELTHWGLTPEPIPVDSDGMRTDVLAREDPQSVLVTPAHQFPMGAVLAPQRRAALLAWATQAKALVIEDDYDAEYRYDRAPVPAVQASALDHVAHTGSTSKTLAPALRLGWLIPPRRLRAEIIDAKYASDIASPAIPQLVLAHLLASGAYDRHLRRTRTRQRTRRDAMLAALRQYLPGTHVLGVAAGLHLLVLLADPACDDAEVAERLRANGVHTQPLSWHRHHAGPPGLVLGYAAHTPARITEAVARIAESLPDRRRRRKEVTS
ncbi:PLP-dependent aminotransferase family protein [Streptomyces sp. NPDC093097]|uniref:MocR-like pyridoxine biosynthesis transcription factor PdxR n=1 Tax=Streptomyces sp. NPDC093097 TaxID=3366027 RepID=UPI0038227E41